MPKATFTVTVNTDPVPGDMHRDNIFDTMQRILDQRIGHYNPSVTMLGIDVDAPSYVFPYKVGTDVKHFRPDGFVEEGTVVKMADGRLAFSTVDHSGVVIITDDDGNPVFNGAFGPVE